MTWKIYARFKYEEKAKRELFNQRASHKNYEFKFEKEFVGRSADPAYSDKEGYQYLVMYRMKEA